MLDSFKHLVSKKTKEETQIEEYQKSAQKAPNNVNIRLKLGDLYTKIGNKKAAIQEYTTAAIQYANDGFLVKAIAVNKIIVRLDPARQEALDRLSDLYFQRGITADSFVQEYRDAHHHEEEQEISAPPEAGEQAEPLEEIDLTAVQREQVSLGFYGETVPLLASLSEESRKWLEKQTTLHKARAKEYLLRDAAEPESLFVLLEGEAKIYTKDKEGEETLLEQLGIGGFWGGMFLFAPIRQTQEAEAENPLSVIADQNCRVLEIPKAALAALVKREPDLSESLLLAYYKRKTSDITLARVPLFSHLDPIERRKIAEQLTPVTIHKGATILTEGEMGDEMYVIKSGQVGVYTTLVEEEGGVSVIKTDQDRLHLATLKAGDFFGEQALITREPRSATIIALTDVQLMKFTKHDLAIVVKQHPRVGAQLTKYHQRRIADTMESLKAIW